MVMSLINPAFGKRCLVHRCFQSSIFASMPVTVQTRIVIEGGALKVPWVPREIVQSAGSIFVEMSKSDRKLQQFIGAPNPTKSNSPLALNTFFGDMLKSRNAACDDAMWEHLKATDPLLQDDGDKAAIVRQNRTAIDLGAMPETVSAWFPAVECMNGDEHLKHDAIEMKFLFQPSPIKKVWIECTPSALEYVRVAAVAAMVDQDREKRKKSLTGVPGVCCDKRRKTVYMVVRGEDGEPQRVQAKVGDWEPTYIAQAAQSLLDQVQGDEAGEVVDEAGDNEEVMGEADGDDSPSPKHGESSPGHGMDDQQ